jgi:hypothetical protein
VDVPEFYTAVTSLLLPANEKNKWVGMKTLGQLKWERNIRNEVSLMDLVLLAGPFINALFVVQVNSDHLYTPIERKPRAAIPLVIPRALQMALPYRDRPKVKLAAPTPGSLRAVKSQRPAVVLEPREQKVNICLCMFHLCVGRLRLMVKMITFPRTFPGGQVDVDAQDALRGSAGKEARRSGEKFGRSSGRSGEDGGAPDEAPEGGAPANQPPLESVRGHQRGQSQERRRRRIGSWWQRIQKEKIVMKSLLLTLLPPLLLWLEHNNRSECQTNTTFVRTFLLFSFVFKGNKKSGVCVPSMLCLSHISYLLSRKFNRRKGGGRADCKETTSERVRR